MTDDNNRLRFVEEQYVLGVACFKKDELDQAIEHFSAIKPTDNRKIYAKAQFNLGVCYQKKNELTKTVEHWRAVEHTDDAESYAKARFNLGVYYDEQNDLVKAIEHWHCVRHTYDARSYAKAQFNLGAYYHQKGELTEAIKHFSAIERTEDNDELYAKVQLVLGVYYHQKGELTEAIKHFSAIERKDTAELYAKARYDLGLCYHQKNELTKAVEYWSAVEHTVDAELYAKAQFSISNIYYLQDHLEVASTHIRAALAQLEHSVYEVSVLLEKINTVQAYAKSHQPKDDEEENCTEFKAALDSIDDNVYNILNSLLIRFEKGGVERKVATYTPVHVAKIFIDNKQESFHLNIANCMNDPTEGQCLFQWMACPDNTETTNTLYGFLTSFTFNHNSLNQFRLYGKTDGKEGTGVSVVVSTEMFSDKFSYNHIDFKLDKGLDQFKLQNQIEKDQTEKEQPEKDGIEKDQRALTAEKILLYRCIYINPENGYISLARRSRYSFFLEHGDLESEINKDNLQKYEKYKKIIDSAETDVKTRLQAIRTSYERISALADKKQLREQTDQLIRKMLLPLSFLTKHSAFEEEAECRIIYVTDIANEKVIFEKNRLFVSYGVPLLNQQAGKNYLNKIYLGPKVDNVVKIELQHLYYQQGMSEHIKIEKSYLPLA